MTAYIIRRLVQGAIVLWIVTALIFLVMRLLPGDPLMLFIYEQQLDALSEEQMQALRVEFGLDKPLILQYTDWMAGIFRGDFGTLVLKMEDVGDILADRLPVTGHIGILALIISSVFGILAGLISALRRGGTLDTSVTSFAVIGVSIPQFWLGILMIYFFALRLGWLPVYGYTSPFDDFWLSTRQLLMPVTVLGLFSIASTARQTRSSMLEVIRQDYIRTAWSKGLNERTVVMRHALKNGLIPVITLVGMHVRLIFGGSVLIETVFNIPGMGRMMVDAVFGQDYVVVQGGVLIMSACIIMANLIVDISYGWFDPRLRYG